MEMAKTIRATAQTSGAVWVNGLQVQFKEGQTVNWPADDAPRAQKSGVILIEETTKEKR